MRLAPKTTEEWFRADKRAAIVITIGVPVLGAILFAMKLAGTPPMSWREVWIPLLLVVWIPPVVWCSAYLSHHLKRRAARPKNPIDAELDNAVDGSASRCPPQNVTRYMAQAFTMDPKVERHFSVTDLLCGIAVCQECKCEPVYRSDAPELSDKQRYDQAAAMQAAGWVVLADNISLLCPECAARRFGAI